MDAETLSTIILLGSFLLMVFLRFPIAYSVGISTVLCLLSMPGQKLSVLPMQMVRGVWSFSLMAVPFFITMGVLMGSGGISEKLIALANSLVGWMRGGLAMVNIVASYFFGGISGSAAADTASLGSILIPMMVDEGYDVDFSTAVTITSSCEGLLVPPSHNMVIYATTAGGISVGALFMAGYLPGALLAIALMVGSYIIAVKRNYPKGERFSLKICAYKPFRYKGSGANVQISTDPRQWAEDPTWLIPCNADIYNAGSGELETKIMSRGLYDSFMSELAYFLLHRKRYEITVETTVAQLADIPFHWLDRYDIGGKVGYINKVNYQINADRQLAEVTIDFFSI